MDFTQDIYKSLLEILKLRNYTFQSFQTHLEQPKQEAHLLTNSSLIIMRHDVDRIANNALELAQYENSIGIRGTYYFRVVPESFDLDIMNKIADLGHEIGYHYEDVDLVLKLNPSLLPVTSKLVYNEDGQSKNPTDALIDAAYESFCKNLELFRKEFDIKTICMHGSPRAKYDNKIIWEKYNYKDLGLIGEPYYDINFNEFAYFTDTGRRWNGNKVSVRDKVNSKFDFNFKSTQEIIDNIDKLPDKVMFTIHPERWHNRPFPWLKELALQNLKNLIKRGLLIIRN